MVEIHIIITFMTLIITYISSMWKKYSNIVIYLYLESWWRFRNDSHIITFKSQLLSIFVHPGGWGGRQVHGGNSYHNYFYDTDNYLLISQVCGKNTQT